MSLYSVIVYTSHCYPPFQIDLILSFEELLESLGIRHRFVKKESTKSYPNAPMTLLPQWCKKKGVDEEILAADPDEYYPGRLGKVRKWIAKQYSKLWITDDYSTSGVRISEAIKPPPVGTSVVML